MGPDGEPGLTVDLGRPRPIEVGSGSVAVREWGDPAGPPVLFLHGLGPTQSAATMGLAASPLVEAGFRLVGFDQPGFGASRAAPDQAYDVRTLGDLVWDVAGACRIERPVILGHSWGATIACRAVAAQPERVRALVLADSGQRDWGDDTPELLATPLEDIIRGGESVRMRGADRAAVAATLAVPVDDDLVDVVLAALVDDGSGGLISRVTGEILGNAQYHAVRARPTESWPTIAASGTPTLLLLATEPEAARAGNERDLPRFAAAVPQAEVGLVEGASHQMIIDLRERFGILVSGWLERSLA